MVGLEDVEIRTVRNFVGFVEHQQRGMVFETELGEDGFDSLDLPLRLRTEASTTCSSKSAWRASSRVALNDATSAWGKSRMKPTVSDKSTFPPPLNFQRRVRVSSVAKSLSSTSTPASVSAVHQRALAGVGVADE